MENSGPGKHQHQKMGFWKECQDTDVCSRVNRETQIAQVNKNQEKNKQKTNSSHQQRKIIPSSWVQHLWKDE